MSKKRTIFILVFLLLITLLFSGCDIIMKLLGIGEEDLDAPANLTIASTTSTSISLSWSSVSGATEYKLFSDQDNYSAAIYTGAQTTYTHTGLQPNTTYSYKVKASNDDGDSSFSGVATGTTNQVFSPPLAPAQIAVSSPTSTTLTIIWSESVDATSYKLFSNVDNYSIPIYTGSDTTYTHTGLTPDTRYYYQVKASNIIGDSSFSNLADGTTLDYSTPPAPPANLTVSAITSNSITLTWSSVSDATSYKLYYGNDNFTNPIYTGTETTFTHENLSPNTTYYYKVQASNPVGDGNLSSAIYDTTQAVVTLPNPPATVTIADTSSTTITVSWSIVANATSYKLFSSTHGDTTPIYTGTNLSYTQTNLQPDTTYTYKVKAVNNAGDSLFSNSVQGTTDPENQLPPPAPDFVNVYNATETSLTVNWGFVAEATSYKLFSSSNGYASPIYSGANTTYTQGSLASNTTYYYYVIANNENGDSPQSPTASGATLTAVVQNPPATPTGYYVYGETSNSLIVRWDSMESATSYQLFSSLDNYTNPIYNGPNTSYTHEYLTPETAYYYKVRATNQYGSSPLTNVFGGVTLSDISEQPPYTPSGLVVTNPTTESLDIYWNPSEGADYYQVYYSGNEYSYPIYDGSATGFTHYGLYAGTTYTYLVRAYNNYGYSDFSYSASGTTQSLVTSFSVSGYVSFNNLPVREEGTLYVYIISDLSENPNVVAYTSFYTGGYESYITYNFPSIPQGVYYVWTYLDTNFNGVPEWDDSPFEPRGIYGGFDSPSQIYVYNNMSYININLQVTHGSTTIGIQ